MNPVLFLLSLAMKKKQRNNLYQKAFKKFCSNTSIHGFVFVPRNRGRKTWISLITISAFYCFYQCKLNIDSYLRFDITTKNSLMYPENVTFPAVTFCPQFPHKRSTFASMSSYPLVIAEYYAKTTEERTKLINEVQ